MPRRRTTAVCLALLAVTGCTGVPRRATPAAKAPAGPPPKLANTTPLAIVADPVQPVGYSSEETARRLHREAEAAYARQPSYISRLRRREMGPAGKPKSDEVIMMRFRDKPWSIHFKWLGEEGKGREIVYSRGLHENKLHVLTAGGDIPLIPGGKHMSFALDSPLVRASSRYPITEAGVGNMIVRYGKVLEDAAKPGSGAAVKSLGPVTRPEYPGPLEAVECVLPPNYAPEVPLGGKRTMFFDPATKFPVISTTLDLSGAEVDYICLDRFQLDVKLDDDDFNPAKLWPVAAKK